MGGKGVCILLVRLVFFFFLLNKVDLGLPDFLPLLRALAMVDGVAAIGGGLELRSSVPLLDLAWPLQDSMFCRSPCDGYYGANPLLSEAFIIKWGIGAFFIFGVGIGAAVPLLFINLEGCGIFIGSGEENPLNGWLMVNSSRTDSCENFNRWRPQVRFFRPIVPHEDSDMLVIRYLKLDLQLDKDQINVHLITHPSMEVGCGIAAIFDEAAICAGWAARSSFCKWLHLLSSGSGNVNYIFLLEFDRNGCSGITSTSSGMYHLSYLVEYMRYNLCCLVDMVVDKTLCDEICKTYYGVSEASSVINHKASLFIGEVNLYEYCLCCIWIKNGFVEVPEESVKAFSFGLLHRWRVRSLLLLVPRFNERHNLRLSSVMRTKILQLSALQPQAQKPIRSLGEPLGYYRRAHWMRPLRTAIVVARQSSRPICHQTPLTVLTHFLLELLLELCICMLQSLVLATPLWEFLTL